jgi:hypothetical protein
MTQRVKRDRASREFVPVALPAPVVLAVQELVRVRPEIREAHLVGMRLTRGARAHPTLVLVSDDKRSDFRGGYCSWEFDGPR